MTAITPDALAVPALGRINLAAVQQRLAELAGDSRGRASWWVEVTRHLDELAESVLGGAVDLDLPGMTEQLRADAPHLLPRWQRVSAERDGLYAQVSELRQVAGSSAGDPGAVGAVSRAIQELLVRVRRFQERSSDVLFDAYGRDLGGE
jgi:hypothetical protein